MSVNVPAETTWLATPIARHTWETKYRWTEGGVPLDTDIMSTWRRVARHAASAEPADQQAWEDRFYSILDGFRFLPGGRILAGAGTGRQVTLFNCFVMGPIGDDMEGIFESLKEGALTMRAGGGVGYDFSTLRPHGCAARSSGRIASGPVSFLEIWDAMCATVFSTGERRGAMLASLRGDHPDILEFIGAKQSAGRLSHFNLSVQVSDELMEAVESGADWPLVFPDASLEETAGAETLVRRWPGFEKPVSCRVLARLPARRLWQNIMHACYASAEPGVLFVDRINRFNNLAYREYITTTNPCGEVPLPPYGACNLGSLNLTQFVRGPFTKVASMDLGAIYETAATAVRLLDDIIDCSQFPLDAQRRQATGSRRIGLGITGLADALIMLGLHYDSESARAEAGRIMETICNTAYETSAGLAREKFPFPWFDRDAYLRGAFVRSLPGQIRDAISCNGMRNSHLTAIAPTGTVSLLAGNISSGIEPLFDTRFNRRVLNRAGKYENFELEDYAFRQWQAREGESGSPPSQFVRATELSPRAHLQMQAVLQPYVDSAISKTVNVPQDCSLDDFENLYRTAWRYGLKGCAAFRPNPLTGSILDSAKGKSRAGCEAALQCCASGDAGD